jgi:hypothetical protein
MAVQQFLAVKENHTHAAASLYSPDLAPCDFWLFPKLKTGLRGRRFATADDIKENAEAGLRAVKKDDFKECFKAWEDRWSKYVCAEGRYFEGD